MKRSLIILITFCGLFNKVYGQSPSAAIDSLIKYRVITVKERSIVEKELKNNYGVSYRVAILGGLKNIILRKTFHINPHRTNVGYAYSIEYTNTKNQDSINRSLRILLGKINKSGLLTDRVYSYTLKDIDSGRYVADLQMIGSLSEMSYRFERLAPDSLLQVAKALHQNDIVSDSSFVRLEDDIKNNKIESSIQLNNYCKLDRTFDLTKFDDDPDIWLEQLHHDIASILPGLTFTNFNYTTEPDTDRSFGITPKIKYKISLVCNGHTYKQSSSVLSFKSKKGKFEIKEFVAGRFYDIFNKILADEQSPFRLNRILFTPGTADDNFLHLSVIALREKQSEVFMKRPCLNYMFASFENYDNELTSARIDTTIAQWKKMVLFAHLSNAEISKAIDDAEADDLFSIDNLLRHFPGVIYSMNSALMSPHNYPYSDLLSQLAKITRGAFEPTSIIEKKKKGGIELQYLFRGKTHSYKFGTKNGWLDDDFPAFVNQLGKENDLQGNFYSLTDEVAVIYLTKQQYDFAVKYKLLTLRSDDAKESN